PLRMASRRACVASSTRRRRIRGATRGVMDSVSRIPMAALDAQRAVASTETARRPVVSQFEVMATQPPPIHRAGGAGGALGNPIGLSGPPPACRLPIRLSRPYDDGCPKAPPTPPALSAVLKVGSTPRVARLSDATGRDGGPPTFLRQA